VRGRKLLAIVAALAAALAIALGTGTALATTAPPAPTQVTAVAVDEHMINVCWTDNSNGTASYVVTNGNSNIPQALPPGTICYLWKNLNPGTYTCFAVIAVINGVYSNWSAYACTTTRLPTPTNLLVFPSLDGSYVSVVWSPGSGTPSDTQYIVTNGDKESPALPAGTGNYRWNLSPANQGQYMCLAVIAVNSVGAWSDWTPYNCGIMPTPAFVAMGDSFSSGQGAPPYLDTSCRTSDNTYSEQYYQLSNTPLGAPDLVACYGAQISDINSQNSHGNPNQPPQVNWISSSTRLITLTIGGNDVNFAGILQDCVVLQVLSNTCDNDLNNVVSAIKNELGPLTSVYKAIKQQAQNAKIVVLTYPKIFPTTTCSGTGRVTPDQLNKINAAWSQFNGVIKSAAASAGVTVVDVEGLFAGHDVCSNTPYANAFLAGDPHASYHPTAAGYAAEAAYLYQKIGQGL
jgi:lysophospholipase L1-like esterase